MGDLALAWLQAVDNNAPIRLELHELLGILTGLALFLIGGIGILWRQNLTSQAAIIAAQAETIRGKDQEILRIDGERILYRDGMIDALKAAAQAATAAERSAAVAETATTRRR